jgi:hypothetical protein
MLTLKCISGPLMWSRASLKWLSDIVDADILRSTSSFKPCLRSADLCRAVCSGLPGLESLTTIYLRS